MLTFCAVLLISLGLTSSHPCWSADSDVVVIGSSPTLRYLLDCGYLQHKPAILSTHDDYYPEEVKEGIKKMQKALGLSETGEKGVTEMLVVREGKCKISKEEMSLIHKTYMSKPALKSRFLSKVLDSLSVSKTYIWDNHPSFLKSIGTSPCNLNGETVFVLFVI